MLSSPPRPRNDPQPLPVTVANLQRIDARTKSEFKRYLKEYVAAQACNRVVYASQGERERKIWKADDLQEHQRRERIKSCPMARMESPLLKARVHLEERERGKEKSHDGDEDRASVGIKEEVMESDKYQEGGHKRAINSRESGARRTRDKNDDNFAREANERTERLAQRRARRRVKKEIMGPSTSRRSPRYDSQKPSRKRKRIEGEGSDNDSDGDTRKKRKLKGKVALGISLMENFTAKNVAHGRLTLPPPSQVGLFNKGRASVKTEIRKSGKENQRSANTFSEFKFLNKRNTLKGRDDCSSSRSKTPTSVQASSSVPPLSAIRRQNSQTVTRPSERKEKAPLLSGALKKSSNKKPIPVRPDTVSDQYSASWGVGSVLPSSDESVQAAPSQPLPEPKESVVTLEDAVDRGTSPAIPSRQASPEVVIKAVPCKWGFANADDVETRLEAQDPTERTSYTKEISKGKSGGREIATYRSRFFPARGPSSSLPPPSPPQIPDANEQSLKEPPEEPSMIQNEFAARVSGEQHREPPYYLEDGAAPYTAPNLLPDDNTSPEENMTHDDTFDGYMYQEDPSWTVAHFIDEHLGPEGYFQDPEDAVLDFHADDDTSRDSRRYRFLMETHDSRQNRSGLALRWDECGDPLNEQYVDATVSRDATDWRDTTRWNDESGIEGGAYEPCLSRSQDYTQVSIEEDLHYDGFTSVGAEPEPYHNVLSAGILADEEPSKEVPYEEYTGCDGQCSEGEDVMLEFSEGRTLLMGMRDGILAEEPMRKSSAGEPRPAPYRLQFGQSVNEIEVMVGKNLGNLWKR